MAGSHQTSRHRRPEAGSHRAVRRLRRLGERPVLCHAHHIRPVSQGGPTDITNMMLICWACHQKVHRHGWRAVSDGRGLYTIEPPDRVHYGPALAPDLLPGHAPDSLSVPSHERPGTANMDDTARSEPPEAHAGPSGPAAARKALREASGYQVGPSPPRPDSLDCRRIARCRCSTSTDSPASLRVGGVESAGSVGVQCVGTGGPRGREASAGPSGLRPSRRSPQESRPQTLGRRILPRLDPGGGS